MAAVTLTTSDGTAFDVDASVACMFAKVGESVTLPGVNRSTLSKVLEYATRAFAMAALNTQQLFELTIAADHLGYAALTEATVSEIADRLRGKTAEEIRAEFAIENDFTPEEEAVVRAENAWAFDELA